MRIKALGLIMILFLTIAVGAVALIFQPVKIKQGETISAPAATSEYGLMLRLEAWKVYPTYNGGLGLIAIAAFTGAILTASQMCKLSTTQEEVTEGEGI